MSPNAGSRGTVKSGVTYRVALWRRPTRAGSTIKRTSAGSRYPDSEQPERMMRARYASVQPPLQVSADFAGSLIPRQPHIAEQPVVEPGQSPPLPRNLGVLHDPSSQSPTDHVQPPQDAGRLRRPGKCRFGRAPWHSCTFRWIPVRSICAPSAGPSALIASPMNEGSFLVRRRSAAMIVPWFRQRTSLRWLRWSAIPHEPACWWR